MKPFPRSGLTGDKRSFLYRLGRARLQVERAFDFRQNVQQIETCEEPIEVQDLNFAVIHSRLPGTLITCAARPTCRTAAVRLRLVSEVNLTKHENYETHLITHSRESLEICLKRASLSRLTGQNQLEVDIHKLGHWSIDHSEW
ncbi:hypothetical protein RRG08_014797 [Elysia crispata]|uniref:Uncharacterized protein n=1 Tax=Elysia crispata TaxID=231223 RepID=A0AAE1E5F9_9GAST|nr:hypothetical protein RRG08_014797 [Elysia crispata]